MKYTNFETEREKIAADLLPGHGLQAINRIRSREELRRAAFRHYPGGSFGPRIRSQMAESIEAHMALGRREEK